MTFYYNFVRLHQTLRITPAMAAGVSNKLWEMGDVVKLLEDYESKRIEHKRLTAITPLGAWKECLGRGLRRPCLRNGGKGRIRTFDTVARVPH